MVNSMWEILEIAFVVVAHIVWAAAVAYEWYHSGFMSAISVAVAIPVLIAAAAFVVFALPAILALAVILGAPILLLLLAN